MVGKSGSGKTSTLRLISGLDYVEDASIKFNETIWQERGYFLVPEKRNIGSFSIRVNLFPYMDISENLNFTHKRSKNKISKNFYDELLNSFMIEDLLKKYPSNYLLEKHRRFRLQKLLFLMGIFFVR